MATIAKRENAVWRNLSPMDTKRILSNALLGEKGCQPSPYRIILSVHISLKVKIEGTEKCYYELYACESFKKSGG